MPVMSDAAAVDLTVGQSVKIHGKFERRTGFDKAFTLNVLGLPDGVTAVAVPVQPGTKEADIELKATAAVKPGVYAVVLNAITAYSAQVMLDRVSQPITLTVLPVKAAGLSPRKGSAHLQASALETSSTKPAAASVFSSDRLPGF